MQLSAAFVVGNSTLQDFQGHDFLYYFERQNYFKLYFQVLNSRVRDYRAGGRPKFLVEITNWGDP